MTLTNDTPLTTEYEHSWALVIGINNYQHLPPLSYAVGDARAVANALRDHLNFPTQRITYLENKEATREAILSAFDEQFTAAKGLMSRNDRLIVFFAGHGITRRGKAGDVGYIAPVDAEPGAWRTLIAMPDLTDLAAFVPAKHIFFVMDACYSGLALTRSAPADPQVQRMLMTPAWQVLTAGKADEEVADGGGPYGRNSIFTSYFVEALNGAASEPNGLITAHGVMSHVYRKIIADSRSVQTPHYGWLRGDGDMVFRKPFVTVLPTAIEHALEHGEPEARVRAVGALEKLSRVTDPGLVHMSTKRLEKLFYNEHSAYVRKEAGKALGISNGKAETQPGTATLTQRQREALALPATPEPSTRRRLVPVLIGLALAGALAAGIFASVTGKASVQQNELYRLQTQSAQDGVMLSTLMTTPSAEPPDSENSPTTVAEADTTPEPTLAPEAEPAAPRPTQDPEPTLAPGDILIFADDFAADTGQWEVGDSGNVARTISGGRLKFDVGTFHSLWVSRPSLPAQHRALFSADVEPLQSEGDFSYGLIFRQVDFDNYYYFLVNNQGSYFAVRQFEGAVAFLVEPAALPPDVALPGEEVRLSVLMVGPRFTFYINGQEVASAFDTAFSTGRLGLAVQTFQDVPVQVAFDNVSVELP